MKRVFTFKKPTDLSTEQQPASNINKPLHSSASSSTLPSSASSSLPSHINSSSSASNLLKKNENLIARTNNIPFKLSNNNNINNVGNSKIFDKPAQSSEPAFKPGNKTSSPSPFNFSNKNAKNSTPTPPSKPLTKTALKAQKQATLFSFMTDSKKKEKLPVQAKSSDDFEDDFKKLNKDEDDDDWAFTNKAKTPPEPVRQQFKKPVKQIR